MKISLRFMQLSLHLLVLFASSTKNTLIMIAVMTQVIYNWLEEEIVRIKANSTPFTMFEIYLYTANAAITFRSIPSSDSSFCIYHCFCCL